MSEFLERNLLTVFVFYSLAFFVIFFAIILRRGHTARFDLVNTFMFLAGFGLMHGIGDFLVIVPPIFKLSVADAIIVGLIAKYFAAVSFIFLYFFGLAVFLDKQANRIKWAVYTSPIFTVVLFLLAANPFQNAISSEIIFRLFLGLPSSMFAALALWNMSNRFKALNMSRIVMDFRGAAIAFLFYGIFAGLFFTSYPGSTLILGLPVQVFRAIAAIAIACFTVRILSVFER